MEKNRHSQMISHFNIEPPAVHTHTAKLQKEFCPQFIPPPIIPLTLQYPQHYPPLVLQGNLLKPFIDECFWERQHSLPVVILPLISTSPQGKSTPNQKKNSIIPGFFADSIDITCKLR